MKRLHDLHTREIEINSNMNSLSRRDRSLLYLYFVLNLPKSTLKFIHKQGYKEVQRRLCDIIQGLVK